MKLNTKGKQAFKLVRNLLTARRNGNIKHEQAAYDKLRDWCEKNNGDMEHIINQMTEYMKNETIAPRMNGIV